MTWIALATAIAGIISLILPRVWKSPEEKEAERKEKAKEEWDAFYKKTQ